MKSEPNVGSTFAFFIATRLSLPPKPSGLEVYSSQGHGDAHSPLLHPDRELTAGPPETQFPYSVLIVEDNIVNVSHGFDPKASFG